MAPRIRHFVGVESSEQLAFIDELHALGLSSTIELPELVVVGDQNTGKSSVLQAITELSFPVQDLMCTLFPIQISFRQTTGSTPSRSRVRATITPGPMTEKDDALLERIKSFVIEQNTLSAEEMGEIIKQAEECIFGLGGKGDGIVDGQGKDKILCDATLRIERSGPDEMHWTIVDLPGLIRRSTGSQSSNSVIAEDIVRRRLQNERNIVLQVPYLPYPHLPLIDDVDVERQKSLEIIASIPGLTNRCIGILNKCDKREPGSGQWMVSLLQNNLSTVPHLNHGWFGLRNRRPIEPNLSDIERDEAEEREFEQSAWAAVPRDRCGIKSLMSFVDRERRAQIQKGMPAIISEIRSKLRECEADLRRMGEARNSPRAQRYFVLQFCNEMQRMTEACLRGQYHDIPSQDPKARLRYMVQERLERFTVSVFPTRDIPLAFGSFEAELKNLRALSPNPETWEERIKREPGIYSEIYHEAMLCRGRSLPGSVHPDVEEKVFRKLSAHWEECAREMVDDAKTLVKNCYDILLRLAIPNNRVRFEVGRVISSQLEEWNRDTDNALRELIEDNQVRPLFTHNPCLEQNLSYADQQRNAIFHGRQSKSPSPSPSPDEGQDEESAVEENFLPNLLNNIIQTRAKLECYYEIAVYRFIDNVAMQVVERHILGPKCPLRAVSLEMFAQLDNEELNHVAGEDTADVSTRQRLERARDRYRKALEKWEQLSVL
ncbi:P-loop containing nucleoside triphosphate hydrolase protein [Aspergillus granulosus]|uniref:P-loop containing nucleoside triphosphate hydrolase protein n=1 Tax=Aspergillus granulosus TaxID=176169 RepID=A0ABR4HAB7_9EURO